MKKYYHLEKYFIDPIMIGVVARTIYFFKEELQLFMAVGRKDLLSQFVLQLNWRSLREGVLLYDSVMTRMLRVV